MKYEKFDLPPRAALFFDALAYVRGFMQAKVGQFTFDLSTASGNQSISGVGFQPKAVILLASSGGSTFVIGSIGFGDGVASGGLFINGGAGNSGVRGLAVVVDPADSTFSNFQQATLASLDSNGFTLAWTKAGSPTGIATLSYLALGG